MNRLLTEEQRLLHDSISSFLAEKSPPAALRRLRDTRDAKGFDPALWRQLADLGIAGMLVPEQQGGLGMDVSAACIVAREMGRQLTAAPFVWTSVLAVWALKEYGSADQQAAYLPSISAGLTIATVAFEEQVRHAPGAILASVVHSVDGFVLKGEKRAAPFAHACHLLLTLARLDGTPALILLPGQVEGMTVDPVRLLDSHMASHICFEDVQVSKEQIIRLPDGCERALDAGRIVLAAELAGCAVELFERTLDYVKQRRQFSRAIGEYQALQHRLAHWHSEIILAEAAVWRAGLAFDKRMEDAPAHASVAKAKAGTSALLSGAEAIQMHGGIGMTDELDVGLFVKRIQTLQSQLGDHRFHADRFAALNGY